MGGMTLADLIPESTEVGFKEEEHMQPVLIDLIQAAMDAVQCDCCLFDTHSASNQLEDPISRPDCTLVAAGDVAMWTQVVSVWEFKIGSGMPERETMFGQQAERCRYVLDAYDQRQYAVAVSFTMNSLEVMTVERQKHEDIKLSTTGPQPFSISDDSPGFQLLVKLLSTAKSDLGFMTSSLPHISQLEDHKFTVLLLVRKGTAQLGSGSWVFSVRLESGSNAILKLNSSSNEVRQPPLFWHLQGLLLCLCLPMPWLYVLHSAFVSVLQLAVMLSWLSKGSYVVLLYVVYLLACSFYACKFL